MEIQQELDRSIETRPALQAPTAHLQRGRKALRRRRLAAGAGALALVIVGTGGYVVVADPGSGKDTDVVADGTDAPVDEFLDEVPYGLVNGCDGDPRPDCMPMPVDFTDAGELRRLPGTEIVVLRHWLELSVEETAAELGISRGTVKSHTSRGLERLRGVLTPTA